MISHTDYHIGGWYNENINMDVVINSLNNKGDWSIVSSLENYDDDIRCRSTRKYYFLKRN